MVWRITGNFPKKNPKGKQDQGQRSIMSIPASTMAQQVRNPPAAQETETWVRSLGQEGPLEKKWQPTPVFLPGKSHGGWWAIVHWAAKSQT